MKYLNIVLTFVAILLALLVVRVYIIPDSNFEKIGTKEAEEIFLDKKSGCLYFYSQKYLGYPETIKVVNLKTAEAKGFFTKDR